MDIRENVFSLATQYGRLWDSIIEWHGRALIDLGWQITDMELVTQQHSGETTLVVGGIPMYRFYRVAGPPFSMKVKVDRLLRPERP